MGRSYLFSCSKCNFSARVAGGEDSGRDCFIRTTHCHDCRQLHDVATHVRLPARLVLRSRMRSGNPQSRFPCRLPRTELRVLVPEHVAVSTEAVDVRPRLPDGMLVGATDPRWVELAVMCPVSPRHRIEPWTDPGRCPLCGTYLDKSLWPFLVWD